MVATVMAATASSSTGLRPTQFLGQTRGSNANQLREVVPMGTGKFTMVFQFHTFILLMMLCLFFQFGLSGCWLRFVLAFWFPGERIMVWTGPGEVLGTLLRSDTFIPYRRVPRWLWMGHCRIISWPRSLCQEQGPWGNSISSSCNLICIAKCQQCRKW